MSVSGTDPRSSSPLAATQPRSHDGGNWARGSQLPGLRSRIRLVAFYSLRIYPDLWGVDSIYRGLPIKNGDFPWLC